MRLFIAIQLPSKIEKEIGKLQDKFKKISAKDKISWVKPENVHVTLKFLGETDLKYTGKIISVMEKAVSGMERFDILIEDTGVFPSAKNPRVMWIDCKDEGENITAIKRRLDRGLKRLGFGVEKKKFQPHLTIARIRHLSKDSEVIEKFLMNKTEFGKIEAGSIQLISSELSSTGSKYEVIGNVEF
jgi:2'-5' RNA ligase